MAKSKKLHKGTGRDKKASDSKQGMIAVNTPNLGLTTTVQSVLDLPVDPDKVIESCVTTFRMEVSRQLDAADALKKKATDALTEAETELKRMIDAEAVARAEEAVPHLEQARWALGLTGELSQECDTSSSVAEDGTVTIRVSADYFPSDQEKKKPVQQGYYSSVGRGVNTITLSFTIEFDASTEIDGQERILEQMDTVNELQRRVNAICEQSMEWRKKMAALPKLVQESKARMTHILVQQSEQGRLLEAQLLAGLHAQTQSFTKFASGEVAGF